MTDAGLSSDLEVVALRGSQLTCRRTRWLSVSVVITESASSDRESSEGDQ
jgi:hypothetical protein